MRRLAVILMLCAVSGVIRAQEVAGHAAMSFSRISPDPCLSGMGYAGRASVSHTAWAVFRNPGATACQKSVFDVAASCQKWAPGGENSAVTGFGAAFRHGRFGLSAGLLDSRAPYDADLGFAPGDRLFGLGAGLAVTEKVTAGISVLDMKSGLLRDVSLHANAVHLLLGANLGAFRLTGGLASLGTLVQGNKRTPLPTSLALAAEWEKAFGPHALRTDTDLDIFLSGGFTAALGVEYGWNGTAFLRAGYHFADSRAPLPRFASLGAGLQLDRSVLPFLGRSALRLDFAWLTAHPILGNTLSFGLAFAWI